jgi:PAS domain S-box-containing protein
MSATVRILLVQDNPGDVDLVQELLGLKRDIEYEFAHVRGFSAALNILRDVSPDIVVLDFNIVDSSGIAAVKCICDTAPDVPCIVLGCDETPQIGIEVVRAGAQDYLAKGYVSADMLVRVIHYAIERNRSTLRLQESELFFRSALNSFTSFVAIVDKEGGILAVNTAWQQFAEKNGVLGGHCSQGLNYLKVCRDVRGEDTEYALAIADGIERVLQRESSSFEMEYPCRVSGQKYWFWVRVTPLASLRKAGCVVAHENITERKKLEISLRTSEQQMRAVFDTTPNFIFIKDASGRYLTVNRAVTRLYGMEEADFIGKTDLDLAVQLVMTEEEARQRHEEDRRVLESNTALKVKVQSIVDKKSQKHWVRKIKKPIMLPDGQVCVLGIAVDISDQHEMEVETRNSEIRLRTILDNLKSKVVLLDTELRVVWPNSIACEQAGMHRQDIIGNYCYDIWKHGHEVCNRCPVKISARSMEVKSAVQTYDDGRTWLITGCPVIDGAGRLMGIVEVSEDITERIELEGQVRQAQKMESLGTLAGGIAHDFNNILTAILGFTELGMTRIEIGSEQHEDLQEVYQAGIRAKELVNQILTFSRRVETELQPLQVRLVVREAMRLLRSTLPSTLEFRQNIDDGDGLVMADPTQIHQIVMNLCTNAAHAMERQGGGVLSVDIDEYEPVAEFYKNYPRLRKGKFLRMRIGDTGCGMSPEVIASIFDPYFTTKDLGEGTGLGLSVVHGIVQECGGEILVDSKVGKGSIFTILVPLLTGMPVDYSEQNLDDTDIPQGNEWILVVDDELPILSMTKRILEPNGYRVKTESDPRKALQEIRANPALYDLIISDVTMPGMSGDKFAQAVLAVRPDLPVILMTGFSNLMNDDILEHTGVKEIMIKPLGGATLVRRVRKILDEAANCNSPRQK